MRFNVDSMVESEVVSMCSKLATAMYSEHPIFKEDREEKFYQIASLFEYSPADVTGHRTWDNRQIWKTLRLPATAGQWSIILGWNFYNGKLTLWQVDSNEFRHYEPKWDDEQFVLTFVEEGTLNEETHDDPITWRDIAQALDELEMGGQVDELNEEGKRKFASFRKYLGKLNSTKS